MLHVPTFRSRPRRRQARLRKVTTARRDKVHFLWLVGSINNDRIRTLLYQGQNAGRTIGHLLRGTSAVRDLIVPLRFLLLQLNRPITPPNGRFHFRLNGGLIILCTCTIGVILRLSTRRTPTPNKINRRIRPITNTSRQNSAKRLPRILLVNLTSI